MQRTFERKYTAPAYVLNRFRNPSFCEEIYELSFFADKEVTRRVLYTILESTDIIDTFIRRVVWDLTYSLGEKES